MGHLAVQIAVAHGARVLGTASERNHDFLRELGAEPLAYGDGLVDAVRELVPDGVDAVLDLAGGQALEQTPALLRVPGRSVSVVDPAVADQGGTYVFVRPEVGHLRGLTDLVDSDRLRPAVQSTHPLEQVRAAVEEAQAGVRGKVVLTVGAGH